MNYYEPKILFDRYEVSCVGSIYDLKRDKFVPQFSASNGYLYIHINGKTQSVHKIVAMAFLNHKEGDGLVVDHKNCRKDQNFVDNLQLITSGENVKKYYEDKKNGLWVNERTEKDREKSKKYRNEKFREYQKEYQNKRYYRLKEERLALQTS